MDWILENLRVVVLVVIVVVWVLRSFGRKPEDAEPGAPRKAPGHDEASENERTRQIQEEIRRRILARQRGETIPPPLPPPVAYETGPEVEEPEYLEEGPRSPTPSAVARAQAEAVQAGILEQQRLLAEQLHALRAARAAGSSARALSSMSQPGVASDVAARRREWRQALRRDLRHPSGLRRAILLKEILGDPIALRRGGDLPRR